MTTQKQFRSSSLILLIAGLFALTAGRGQAATIALTPGTPVYSYDILTHGTDPNVTFTGTMRGTTDASYYTTDPSIGSLSYTFSTAVNADNLNVNEYNLYAFGGNGSLTASYSIDGGPTTNLYTASTAAIAPGGSQVVDVQYSNNIALNPATAHTVVLTYTENATGDSNYMQQLLRHGNADGGPFIATATFVPEPSSLILCGIAAVGLIAAARRRRKA